MALTLQFRCKTKCNLWLEFGKLAATACADVRFASMEFPRRSWCDATALRALLRFMVAVALLHDGPHKHDQAVREEYDLEGFAWPHLIRFSLYHEVLCRTALNILGPRHV